MKKATAVTADIWAVNPNKKKLSASQISTFLACPRKYKFSYIDKIKTLPSAIMIQSSAWHAVVESNYNQKISSRKDLKLNLMLDMYKKEFKNRIEECEVCRKPKVGCEEKDHKYKAIEVLYDEGENYESVLEMGLRIVEAHHRYIAPGVKPLAAEEKFIVGLDENIDIIGVFDVRGDGYIADNKAKGRTPSQSDFDKDVQFSLYCWAYWKKYKKIPKLYMHLIIRTKDVKAMVMETTRSKEQLLWLETQMREVGAAIKGGGFYPNTGGYLCSPKWCGHWDRCMNGKV